MKKLIVLIPTLMFLFSCQKNHERDIMLINTLQWHCQIDSAASWKDDSLHLPGEFDLSSLPQNIPTGGWETLQPDKSVACNLPASIEELFGTSNEWTYRGVSWFWTEVDIPAKWTGKRIMLEIGQYRMRLEIYVNQQLAGYDLIALTPYTADISKFLKAGKNQIAFRLTNPGGIRGWEDYHLIPWGKIMLPATPDFMGIGGDVKLYALDSLVLNDVFVKNILPSDSKQLEINIETDNTTTLDYTGDFHLDIISKTSNTRVFSESFSEKITQGTNTITRNLSIPDAIQWSPDQPELYTCQITMQANGVTDALKTDFGFRVFEANSNDHGSNFYFNGKRVRIRSAIDWGIYALTGLYATPQMAASSVKAAKDIGHNCISFHRRIGEPLVMEEADRQGLFIYEEPGGLHTQRNWENANMEAHPFAMKWMKEKIRRMVIRDRNHPSLIIYSLVNEDKNWNPYREDLMRMVHSMDDSRLVINASGDGGGLDSIIPVYHMRPYSTQIDSNYYDKHTVQSDVGFNDRDFSSHAPPQPASFTYWGEVRCYTGPPAAWQIVNDCDKKKGYDMNLFSTLNEKINEYFSSCHISECGSRTIKNPGDITKQCARGLMYVDGRLDQIILSHDATDGFAINGWSDGPQTLDPWSSAITDGARNLKGPAEDYRFWNSPLQIAIFRANGKYFKPGDSARFNLNLINEGKLSAGNYQLSIRIKDGDGQYGSFNYSQQMNVAGEDVYAQKIINNLAVFLPASLKGGYLTLEATLKKDENVVASGVEQVLFSNRALYAKDIQKNKICVIQWPAASQALSEAVTKEYSLSDATVILAGQYPGQKTFADVLKKVDEGARLIIRFDSLWAIRLLEHKLLSQPVTTWGGKQTPFWNGNGWGYIDYFIGDQALPSPNVISTRGWETNGDPRGFWPFKSTYRQEAYGAYIAREQHWGYVWDTPEVHKMYEKMFPKERQLLVMYGGIEYGKGKIVLAASYPVDDHNPLNDLIFFQMICKK